MKTNFYNTRLEKAAIDNGFDLFRGSELEWLKFASSHAPLVVWLCSRPNGGFAVAVSDTAAASFVANLGATYSGDLPLNSSVAVEVKDLESIYGLLKRAFQVSRALPSEPLNEFQKQTKGLPQSTEVERLVIQRVGQDIFRERLFEFWDGKCAVTGLSIPALLRASHIRPWSECVSDAERLDVFNGLLLAPHLDAVFDRGFITFGDDGCLMVSKHLGHEGLKTLGIDVAAKCDGLTADHQKYLAWHRTNEFQST